MKISAMINSNPKARGTYCSCLISLCLVACMLLPGAAWGQEQAPPRRSTAVQEDVNEFLGYEDLLLVRYLSLPYDVVMNTNVPAYFAEIGFLVILFLPFIYLTGTRTHWGSRVAFVAICLLFLILAVPSAYINSARVATNTAAETLENELSNHPPGTSPLLAAAYQIRRPFIHLYQSMHPGLERISGNTDRITYPLLFGLLALLFLLLESRVRHLPLASRSIAHFLLVFGFLWLLLSSGIPWYGLLLVPLLILFSVRGLLASGRQGRLATQILLIAVSSLWLVLAFAYRFGNYPDGSAKRSGRLFLGTVANYQIGRYSTQEAFARSFPQYPAAVEVINQDSRSYVYRVGTVVPFFIEKNDRRVFSDNFLDFFQNLRQEIPNDQEIARALRAYGFRYLIVDLNLSTNDNTREGTLRNKFNQFSEFLYNNPQLRLITTDRVFRGPDGIPYLEVFPRDNSNLENPGQFAAYQIL